MTGELWVLCSLIGLGLAVGVLIAAGWAADHRITTRARTASTGTPMPDSLPFLLLALLLAAAVRCLHVALAPDRGTTHLQPDTEPRVYAACHRPQCGHLEWPQHQTPQGMVCAHCGLPPAPAS